MRNMNSQEIILANINHEDPPRPGMTFGKGRMNDLLVGVPGPSRTYTEKRWIEGKREYYDDEWGNIWVRMIDGSQSGEIHQPVIADWSDLDTLQVPDYEDPTRYEEMRELFSKPTDKFKLAVVGGWVFNDARYLRKMESYFADMAMYPQELARLHSMVAKVYEAKIRNVGQAGADGILLFEDLGTQTGVLFSPAMFRKFFKEEYARLWGIAHDHGMKVVMHSCGNNWELVDDLIEAGVDCFQFDQPAVYDMPALAAKFHEHKVALWSPIDIQQVLPTGDREFIEAETDHMIECFRGGLILKDYGDLAGIGVKEEWDMWAYQRILQTFGIQTCKGEGDE